MSADRELKRPFFVPEVVQTSGMDCGPASLSALLSGLGTPVSYGRLREACQTSVDGTSIDTMEDLAVRLGLDAEQVLEPVEHLLMPEARMLPAIVVILHPDGFTHFVVVWRVFAGWVQVMDPGVGRTWYRADRFLRLVYTHRMKVSYDDWWAWVSTEKFHRVLAVRAQAIGVPPEQAEAAMGEPEELARFEAALRMTSTLVQAKALRRGPEAAAMVAHLCELAREEPLAIPLRFRAFNLLPPVDGEREVALAGAVAVRVTGRRSAAELEMAGMPVELVAALTEKSPRPELAVVDALREDGLLAPAVLAATLLGSAMGTMVEALVLRGMLDIGGQLVSPLQRLGAGAALLVFLVTMVLLELPEAALRMRLGRLIEAKLRAALQEKIPQLGDAYIRSRPISDLAQRGHALHVLRGLPGMATSLLRSGFGLALTVMGLIWLAPPAAPIVLGVAVMMVVLPMLTAPLIATRDLKARTHTGAVFRFYLDALLGQSALRTLGAGSALSRQHDMLVVDWGRATLDRARLSSVAQLLQGVLGALGAAAILGVQLRSAGQAGAGSALLLVYWALALPSHGDAFGQSVRQYPVVRNLLLRLLEPLGAPAEPPAAPNGPEVEGAVALELRGVEVVAGGQSVLRGLDLRIEPGEHVAIVGPSGAGKSSLFGILQGWHRAEQGEVLIDQVPLDPGVLARLRERTAWVDPAVQIWNRSMLENLRYGLDSEDPGSMDLAALLDAAALSGVAQRLPEGMRSSLGESGGLLSGGEGQRVRLARAMLRRSPGLVLLDEAFRGLDHDRRLELLAVVRAHWRDATLLCVSHDVEDTAGFDRVLVIEGGQIVEDAPPAQLLAQEDSRYRALFDAALAARAELWSDERWSRVRVEGGQVRVGTP